MSDDLISRKALLDRFRYEDKDSEYDKSWITTVRRIIKEQPMAFDKKKVIKYLQSGDSSLEDGNGGYSFMLDDGKTPEEAVKTTKSNMPISEYRMLLESLAMVISALNRCIPNDIKLTVVELTGKHIEILKNAFDITNEYYLDDTENIADTIVDLIEMVGEM